MQTLTIFLGLLCAGIGHALLHDWRGAVALWEDLDRRFPPELRTPTELAGPLMLAAGAVCVAAPMFG